MTNFFKKCNPHGRNSLPYQREDLLSLLRDKPEDEKGGVNTTLGITYQQWWATLKAADLYVQENDFAIGMEFKEDVAVLDSPTTPTAVEFYQVKKHERDGVWGWSELLKITPRKEGTPEPSPLAKLYSRRHAFNGYPTKLIFISNLAFKVPLEEGTKLYHSANCGLHEFAPAKANALKQKISDQLGIPATSVDLNNFSLERTHLPLGEQDIFISGKLGTLSDTGKLPFKISRPHVSACMLAIEFQQRGSNTDYANTFDKLKVRCMSKSDITRVLQDVESTGPTIQAALEDALDRLDRESYHYGKIEQIKREKVRLCAHLYDRTNNQVACLSRLFIACRDELQTDMDEMAKLGEMMEHLVRKATEWSSREVAGLSQGYLNGLALLVIKNAININVLAAPTDPQSEEKK
jgi:hypothetical protein